MSESLRDYIRRRLEEKEISSQMAAATVGVTPTYFSRVTTGKVERPGTEFCVKLADLFGDPYTMVLRLAGWIPEPQIDEELFREMAELARTDPRIKDIVRMYREVTSEEERDIFLAMTRAFLEAYKTKRGKSDED